MTDGLLSPKRAAQFLDLHYRTFQALAKENGLKPDANFGTRKGKRYAPETLKQFGKTLARRHAQGAR